MRFMRLVLSAYVCFPPQFRNDINYTNTNEKTYKDQRQCVSAEFKFVKVQREHTFRSRIPFNIKRNNLSIRDNSMIVSV